MHGMRYQPQGAVRLSQNTRGLRLALNGAMLGRPVFGPTATQVGEASRASTVFGIAQSFNGANQALSIPLDLRGTEAVTVVALVDGLGNTGAQQILWEFGADTVGTRQGFDAYVNRSGLLEVWTGSAGTQREGNTYTLPAGRHTLVCTYDHTQSGGAQVALWVDGIRQTRASTSAEGVPRGAFLSSTLYVAARTASSSWASIRLGAFFLFDRALSGNEIVAISQNPWREFADPDDEDAAVTAAATPSNFYALDVQPVAVTIAASNVGMRVSRNLSVEPAALAVATGDTAGRVARRMAVKPLEVSITPRDVRLRVARRLAVVAAPLSIVGGPAPMRLANAPPTGAYVLAVHAGSFEISAGDIKMLVSRRVRITPVRMAVGAGTVAMRYTSTGQSGVIDVALIPSYRIVVFEGSRRVVAFAGSRRVVQFQGSNRIVRFE